MDFKIIKKLKLFLKLKFNKKNFENLLQKIKRHINFNFGEHLYFLKKRFLIILLFEKFKKKKFI